MDIFIGLIPIFATLISVFVFKKILLGLSAGTAVAMLIVTIQSGDALAFKTLWETWKSIFDSWDGKISVIAFLYFASMASAIIIAQGGTSSLADKFASKIKTKKRTLIVVAIIGVLIFIDGLLNSLVVGSTTKHITDKHNVSRAKLSYIVDSTSSPMASLMVLSSWGSYIVTIMPTENPSRDVIVAAFTQYYELFAIALVFVVITIKLDFGPMKKYEESAAAGHDISKVEDVSYQSPTSPWIAAIPFLVFITATIISWISLALIRDTKMLDTYFNGPLAIGTFAMLVSSIIASFAFNKGFTLAGVLTTTKKSVISSTKSMILIVLFAWFLTDQIDQLGLGQNIADAITSANIDVMWLPVVLFIVGSGISFTLGTSWGTFILLIPIFIPIAEANDAIESSVLLSAILGGAVFGDHCSPISDTTIVSASGSGSELKAHFVSQLPYALLCGANAIVGYVAYALIGNMWLPGIIATVTFVLMIVVIRMFNNKTPSPIDLSGTQV